MIGRKQEREWDQACTAFFQSFKSYDEAGDPERLQVQYNSTGKYRTSFCSRLFVLLVLLLWRVTHSVKLFGYALFMLVTYAGAGWLNMGAQSSTCRMQSMSMDVPSPVSGRHTAPSRACGENGTHKKCRMSSQKKHCSDFWV